MNPGRHNVRDMPFRRRHDGMTVLERMAEIKLWRTLVTFLQICILLPAGVIKAAMVQLCVVMYLQAVALRSAVWNPLDPVNKAHANRGIDSFSDEDCYRHMRFRKPELRSLHTKFDLPFVIVLGNGLTCSGEYALCLMLYRLHYPSTLASLQSTFGRDYSQISRIFNFAIAYVYEHHKDKVLCNIDWYADRFDIYNAAYNDKIAALPLNPQPGTVPVQLSRLFASIDCTANEICRPYENNNAQYPFFNQYHHGHFIIWQGVSFPDGMVVLEGPEPGYFTDIMVWRDSQLQQDLENIMQERTANGQHRLFMYADKIYNTGALIKAAWSLRHGPVFGWMHTQNGLMSRIRVHVEWAFERIISASKYAAFGRAQLIQQSPVAKIYTVAVLLANCRTCLYGGIDNAYFGVLPPSLDDYFEQ